MSFNVERMLGLYKILNAVLRILKVGIWREEFLLSVEVAL